MLTATLKNRRQALFTLEWTAPSIGGLPVTGYQVRYAKVPITSTNFTDTTVTTAIPYTMTPKAPGLTDGLEVQLYIENSYYFAVEGTDSSGAQASTFMGTTSAVAAHFEVATLKGTSGSATEGAGYALDGSGDANGDGKSDVLMGSYNGSRAYLFFGTTDFSPTAPSVVFTSTAAGFGQGVAFIGDLDHDGREDLAIANPTTGIVYIYRGRSTWPMTMTDAGADFTVTADSSYAGSLFGSSMCRLGDFNGDGVDDFAIGSPDYGPTTFAGRVTVILGGSGFISLSLPSTSRAITIDGTAMVGVFGTRVVGIGPFYSPSGGTELIASAPGFTGFASSNGAIYAFRGQAAVGGAIPLSSADASIMGTAAGMSIGTYLTNLGAVTNGVPRVGAGNPSDMVGASSGTVYLFSGSASTSPLASHSTLSFSGTTLDPFVLIGGGLAGRSMSVSTIGDSTPDIVIAPRNGQKIAIIDGAKIGALAATADITNVADVIFSLPAPVTVPNNSGGALVTDVNGDGFADFAISDAASNNAGNTLIFY